MSISVANSYLPVAGLSASQHISASAFLTGAAQKTVQSPLSISQDDTVVNISPAARQITETGLPGWVNERIEKLRANPDQNEAMQQIELMVTAHLDPLISIHNGPHGTYYLTYKFTGELVTPESTARYTAIEEASFTE